MENKEKVSFSKKDTLIIKGIAICLMLFHHLFYDPGFYEGLGIRIQYFFNNEFLVIGIADFGKICVHIFVFLSGYGMYISHKSDKLLNFFKRRLISIYRSFWKVFLVFVPIGIVLGKAEFNIKMIITGLFTLGNGYNITWWFMRVYLVLILIFPVINYLLKKTDKRYFIDILIHVLVFVGITYITKIPKVASLRWDFKIIFDYIPTFILGLIISKYDLLSIVKACVNEHKIISIISIPLLYACYYMRTHYGLARYDSIFTLIIVISISMISCLYESKILSILGKHSNNIFMIHTFFYYMWFPYFIYSPRYVLLVFTLLMIISLVSSFALNYFWKFIGTLFERIRKCIIEK